MLMAKLRVQARWLVRLSSVARANDETVTAIWDDATAKTYLLAIKMTALSKKAVQTTDQSARKKAR